MDTERDIAEISSRIHHVLGRMQYDLGQDKVFNFGDGSYELTMDAVFEIQYKMRGIGRMITRMDSPEVYKMVSHG
jgi:hypothetical protein